MVKEISSFNFEDQAEETINLAKALEASDDEVFIRENLPTFLKKLEETLDIRVTNDVNELYARMQEEQCLGRIDNMGRVIAAIEQNTPFKIGEGDSHYANAVIPDPDGIKLAFGEGQAPGAVRMMIGFGKTLIGFKTDHLSVSSVEFDEEDPRDVETRAYLCRHVDGELAKEDIRTIVMRIPRKFVKEELFFDDEKSGHSTFIFRGFSL